jgi:ABC-type methionine transport system permease subunit
MDPLLIVIILALLGTVGAMGLGLLAMSGGGATDRKFSTSLMWTRVVFQGVTLLLLVVAVYLRR